MKNGNVNVEYYKKYRNKLSSLLGITERKYYENMLLQHKSDAKKSWQVIKSIINKRKTQRINTKFKTGNSITEDGNIIANQFNDFFVNLGATLADKIPKSKNNPLAYMPPKLIESFYISPTTELEVGNIIKIFKDNSAGWDDLRPGIIKVVKEYITNPLTHICNLSLSTGVFPHELKIANIVPIYKSGDVMMFSNYRPVSVSSIFKIN